MAIQMKCRRYCIKVTGSIVAKNGNHFAQGWVACGIGSLSDHFEETEFPNKDYKFNEATNTIDGNLILDNTSRLIPYAMYEAEQGIIDFSSDAFPSIMGGITWLPGYAPAKEYYERTITEINSLLSVDMDPIAEETYIRGLFVSVFGAFELFLRDCILCGIFNYDDCYSRAAEYYHFDGSYEKLEKKIFEEINSITFHNFDKVKKLFNFFFRY